MYKILNTISKSLVHWNPLALFCEKVRMKIQNHNNTTQPHQQKLPLPYQFRQQQSVKTSCACTHNYVYFNIQILEFQRSAALSRRLLAIHFPIEYWSESDLFSIQENLKISLMKVKGPGSAQCCLQSAHIRNAAFGETCFEKVQLQVFQIILRAS